MGPNVVCSLVGDGSQPIQLCLGIGVGNPRETVDAENNFSKASCQAPFFFFFSSRGSILLSRIHGQRVVGERTSAQCVRESRNPPFSLSLPLSFPSFLSLPQIYPLNANIVSFSRIFVYYRIYLIYFPVFLLFSFPRFSAFVPLFQKGGGTKRYPISTEISLLRVSSFVKNSTNSTGKAETMRSRQFFNNENSRPALCSRRLLSSSCQ